MARDRPDRPGRPHRRPRRRRKESVPVLRRLRGRGHLADAEQRHDVRFDLRHVRHGHDRRPRAGALRSRTSSTSARAKRTTGSQSSFGNGVWKSTNAMAPNAADVKFEYIGLRETQSIARMHRPSEGSRTSSGSPRPGHLYGPNPERGVFMTTDGGKTWNKTLYITADTGATELDHRPEQPDESVGRDVRASAHRVGLRRRRSRQRPPPEHRRRQDLAQGHGQRPAARHAGPHRASTSARSQPNVIYAQIEAAPDKETGAALDQPAAATPADARAPADRPGRRAQAGGGRRRWWRRWRRRTRRRGQQRRSAGQRRLALGRQGQDVDVHVEREPAADVLQPDPRRSEQLRTPSTSAASSPAEVHRRRQDVQRRSRAWATSTTTRSGSTRSAARPAQPDSKHVMYGNDGGIDVSYDAGARWESIRLMGTALSYHVSADMRRPYWVCTGLQDNGSWCGPSYTRTGGIHLWNWISVGGGDGFQTQVDPTDPNIFYTESQNAGINRYDLNTGTTSNIKPNYQAPRRRPAAAEGGGARWRRAVALGGAGAAGGGAAGGWRQAVAAAVAAAAVADRNVINTPPPTRSSSSTGTRRSGFRRTTRARSTSADGSSSSRAIAATRWMMSPSLGKNIDLNDAHDPRAAVQPAMLRPRRRCAASRASSRSTTATSQNEFGTITELAESPVLPGISGSAPTTATCRSAATAATPGRKSARTSRASTTSTTSRASKRRGTTRARPTSRSTATGTTT